MRTARRLIQVGFVVLTVVGVFVMRGHAERWCPLGGIEGAYQYLKEGNLTCSLGVSNFYILGGVLLATLLLRRAFCGYVCPIGALSEWLQAGARRLGVRPVRVPERLDAVLGLLKYPVLAVILYFTWTVGELVFRGYDPCYVLISRHGEDITWWAYVVTGAVVLASLVLLVPFCRWLCPLAAVFAPFSRFGLTRVRRDASTCTDCGKCARVCPMAIPVDRVATVTHARCTSCLECVAVCPVVIKAKRTAARPGPAAPDADRAINADRASSGAGGGSGLGTLVWGPPGRRWGQPVLIGLLLACIAGAVAASYVAPLPSFVQVRGERPAKTASIDLDIEGASCRHSTMRLCEWLDRSDEYAVPGYIRVEAWPGPVVGAVRITYDPARTTPDAIRRAIVMPTFDDNFGGVMSPYRIRGFTADEL